ncbi:hypothetical protein DL93DRAFT_2064028 [Clavulina sp. PMI_390]|nr:hypothetical protein DL93DRAFT_2064028 [Clavulina sp. PMI_390]
MSSTNSDRFIANPPLITPSELITSLPQAFEKGLESGDLLFFESTVTKHAENGVDFEIRKCPALLHKPTLPTPHFNGAPPTATASDDKAGKPDPFAPPYPKGLCLGQLKGEDDSEYIVMLNKFSVVKHHFLLITKDFQSQNIPPTPPDLVMAYQILLAARRTRPAPREFLAFFNCGERSGASQPHKHLQFIPLEEYGGPMEVAISKAGIDTENKAFSLPAFPYAHYIRRLPTRLQSASIAVDELYDALAQAFMSLLDLTIAAIRNDPEEHPRGSPSYNVILTPEHLMVVPRSKEKFTISPSALPADAPQREEGLSMSINSLGFAGMFLVKSDEEGARVSEVGVVKMLAGVGVPRMADDSLAEPQSRDDLGDSGAGGTSSNL